MCYNIVSVLCFVFGYGTVDHSPDQGSEPTYSSVLGGEVLDHWTAREVPDSVEVSVYFYLRTTYTFKCSAWQQSALRTCLQALLPPSSLK